MRGAVLRLDAAVLALRFVDFSLTYSHTLSHVPSA